MSTKLCVSICLQFRSMVKRVLSRRGFTLVELLVVMMITSILLLIMGKFLIDFHATREVSKVMMQLQEQAEYALDYMIYGFIDPNNSGPGDARRKEGLIWASLYELDNGQNRGKKISFKDPGRLPWIVYEERNKRLIRRMDSSDPNGRVIIPYLEGTLEYRKGPFEVSVDFEKGQNQPDPNKSVFITVTVRKDGLSSTLKSAVTPRNRSSH